MKRWMYVLAALLCLTTVGIGVFRYFAMNPHVNFTEFKVQAGTGKSIRLELPTIALRLGSVKIHGESQSLKLTVVDPKLTSGLNSTDVIISAAQELTPGTYPVTLSVRGSFFSRSVTVVVDVLPEPGSLDTSFGKHGRVFIDTGLDRFAKVQVEENSKILILSWEPTYMGDEANVDLRLLKLTRLNPDGTTDAEFGQQGTLRFRIPEGFEVENAYFSRDRQFVYVITSNGVVLRYTKMSVLDTTFARARVGEQMFFSHFLEDGKNRPIVINGEGYVTRLNLDGSKDATFGNQGSFKIPAPPITSAYSAIIGLGVDDNRIVFAQLVQRFEPESYTLRIGRIAEAGRMDATFANGGFTNDIPHKFTLEASPPPTNFDDLYITPQGYVITRFISNQNIDGSGLSDEYEVSRYTRSGVRDLTFGDRGRVLVEYSLTAGQYIYTLKHLLADGRLPAVSERGFGLINADGRFDTNFAPSEFRRYEPEGSSDGITITDVSQDAAGRIVLVGVVSPRREQNASVDETRNDLVVLRIYP